HAEFDESNANVLERFYTLAGNPVKEILLKLNLPDHRILKDGVKEFQRSFYHSDTERLSRSDEVLKLKNFKKDATLKLFKSTNQERYEHVGPEVTSSHDGQGHKMVKKRLCLVDDLKGEDQPEDQLGVLSTAKILADAAKTNVHTYTRRRRAVSTSSGGISTTSRLFSTAEDSVSTAGASMPVSTAGMVQEVNISIPLPIVIKDKWGGEEEWETLEQELEAVEELTQKLLSRRKETSTVNKEETSHGNYAQQKGYYMINYIKHMGSHTLQQLKRYSFDELKELFETTMKNVNTFVPMETEDRGRASELAAGSSQATIIDSAEVRSSKRGAEAELDHEGSKRQKTNETSGSVQEQPEEEEKELSQEDLQQMMMVVPVEEVYVEALQVKYPIIDWEVYTEESRKYWKIIRVGNHTEAYQFFEDMLKVFDRDIMLGDAMELG
ncbi:hypothetical protein Tco_0122881, partial [Tanacetum coccineum]